MSDHVEKGIAAGIAHVASGGSRENFQVYTDIGCPKYREYVRVARCAIEGWEYAFLGWGSNFLDSKNNPIINDETTLCAFNEGWCEYWKTADGKIHKETLEKVRVGNRHSDWEKVLQYCLTQSPMGEGAIWHWESFSIHIPRNAVAINTNDPHLLVFVDGSCEVICAFEKRLMEYGTYEIIRGKPTPYYYENLQFLEKCMVCALCLTTPNIPF